MLLLLVVTLFRVYAGWLSKKSFTPADRKLSLFTLIATHIQLVLGIVLYLMSDWVRLDDMGEAMKDRILRFFTVEHSLMMLIAIALITIGHSKAKKASGEKKFRTLAIFFTIALVIILAAIPWPVREGIGTGRGWF